MKELSEILYFDPYMRLHSEILYKIFDKRRSAKELREDLLLDFSHDYANDAAKFEEILLEDQYIIRYTVTSQRRRYIILGCSITVLINYHCHTLMNIP